MPRACPVEPHAVSYCSGEREVPRDKPVASRNRAALCSGEREAPRDKPVASRAVWLRLIFKDHQRRGSCGKSPVSRQRRLNSSVADATRRISPAYRGLKPIGIYTNYVQPNPTGGSRWIIQSQSTGDWKDSRNPTTGRWWMVQSQPSFSVVERIGRG